MLEAMVLQSMMLEMVTLDYLMLKILAHNWLSVVNSELLVTFTQKLYVHQAYHLFKLIM